MDFSDIDVKNEVLLEDFFRELGLNDDELSFIMNKKKKKCQA